ncbi:hypothetical protein COU77_02990 [Candidatus Peregrinibacteria bacterium CG10_big_fil_rev_8_21_14_0_10_49_16]|nr:MAG: hypothetical protein COW95_02505 [Candidatus Peregrinibacteria bacterium CG22_combo_CG10-13_8_21_14_all_49_11]PIR52000.1 MAG: hypothetical protein COU77_02990 [Candidatus Peregrinibacteria bacterium CG10_big_fil_rev_8_21_14_0_10_49_16]
MVESGFIHGRREDGEPASFSEFMDMQKGLLLRWDLGVDDLNEKLFIWVAFFAKYVRDICSRYPISLGEFERKFAEFEQRLVPHLHNLQCFLETERSLHQERVKVLLGDQVDVSQPLSFEDIRTAVRIEGPAYNDDKSAVRFAIVFPAVWQGETHTEELNIPLNLVDKKKE